MEPAHHADPGPWSDRWKRILDIKVYFGSIIADSIYACLPGVVENTFR